MEKRDSFNHKKQFFKDLYLNPHLRDSTFSVCQIWGNNVLCGISLWKLISNIWATHEEYGRADLSEHTWNESTVALHYEVMGRVNANLSIHPSETLDPEVHESCQVNGVWKPVIGCCVLLYFNWTAGWFQTFQTCGLEFLAERVMSDSKTHNSESQRLSGICNLKCLKSKRHPRNENGKEAGVQFSARLTGVFNILKSTLKICFFFIHISFVSLNAVPCRILCCHLYLNAKLNWWLHDWCADTALVFSANVIYDGRTERFISVYHTCSWHTKCPEIP